MSLYLSQLVHLQLEFTYEAICTMAKHYKAAGLTLAEAHVFLDVIAAMIQPVKTHYLWRPQLRDPADEMVLEAAVNGGAEALVSFNQRHFGLAPLRFGIKLLLPSELLRRADSILKCNNIKTR